MKMKKLIALLLCLTMVFSLAVLPTLAEEPGETEAQTSTQTAGKKNAPHGGKPGMNQPGGQQPNRQAPADGQKPDGTNSGRQDSRGNRPGRKTRGQDSGSVPATGTDLPSGEQPNVQQPKGAGSGKKLPNGKKPAANGSTGKTPQSTEQPAAETPQSTIDFEAMVKDGVISQETCDAIMKYMQEHQPDAPAADTQSSATTQAAPAAADAPLLIDLLAAGIITESEFAAMAPSSSL